MIVNGYLEGIKKDLHVEVSKNWDLQAVKITLPDDSVYSGEGSNVFEALVQIRNRLEKLGWMVGVAGSRLNASAPPLEDDSRTDQVVLMDSDGVITFVSAMQPASLESLATIYRQQEYTKNVNRIISGQANEEKEALKKNEEVIEIRRETPRMTIGIVSAVLSYFFTAIALFTIIPTQNYFVILMVVLGILAYNAYAIVNCIRDIGYSVSRPSQYGLFILLVQPIVWFLVILAVIQISATSNPFSHINLEEAVTYFNKLYY